MDKKHLTETDIITKLILPSIEQAGWDSMTQLRNGKVIVPSDMEMRKTVKSADIVLYHKPNLPLAVIEAKANKHKVGKGINKG